MYTLVIFLLSCLLSQALAAEAPYTFTSIDITVPGHPGLMAWPEDINDKGEIVSNYLLNGENRALIAGVANPRNNKFRFNGTGISCFGAQLSSAWVYSINDKGQIVGTCDDSDKQYGFVVVNGKLTLLAFPGADTIAKANNDAGQVVGQIIKPVGPGQSGFAQFHCFLWDARTGYRQIDFPRPDTYSDCIGINASGKILGIFATYNPATNDILEFGFFLYDNGQFTVLHSTVDDTDPETFYSDMNDLDQMIAQRGNGGPNWDGLFLLDDGQYFKITPPAGWVISDARGMNNNGQFVGVYSILLGFDSQHRPIFETHGYVATPAPMSLADKKGRK